MPANNYLKEIEKIIEEGNNKFVEILDTANKDEKILLEFFREKYTHFILYKLFKNNGWNVDFEKKTEVKLLRTGKNPRSGNHDLMIFDKKGNRIAGLELFLGYDVGKEKQLTYRQFRDHIIEDYEKLINSNLKAAYIINYFYKGITKRASIAYTEKKEKSYQNHLMNCVIECEKLVKKHKESNLKVKLGVWVVEARDDVLHSKGIKKIC